MASATPESAAAARRNPVGAFRSPHVVARERAATGVHDAIPDLLAAAQIELLPTTPFGGAVIYQGPPRQSIFHDSPKRSLRSIGGCGQHLAWLSAPERAS